MYTQLHQQKDFWISLSIGLLFILMGVTIHLLNPDSLIATIAAWWVASASFTMGILAYEIKPTKSDLRQLRLECAEITVWWLEMKVSNAKRYGKKIYKEVRYEDPYKYLFYTSVVVGTISFNLWLRSAIDDWYYISAFVRLMYISQCVIVIAAIITFYVCYCQWHKDRQEQADA